MATITEPQHDSDHAIHRNQYPHIRSSDWQEVFLNGTTFRIRLFRRSDFAKVRTFFEDIHTKGPGSSIAIALDNIQALKYANYALISAGIALCLNNLLLPGLLIAFASTMAYYNARLKISRFIWDFCIHSLNDDLRDIETHYCLLPLTTHQNLGKEVELMTSGPSAVWIVETIPDDAAVGSEIVGMVCLDYKTNGNGYKNDSEPRAQLRRMAVAHPYRRNGIGKLLINTLIAYAKSQRLSTVGVETIVHQPGAVEMYEQFGWVETERRTIYSMYFGLFSITQVQFVLHSDSYTSEFSG